MIKPVVADLTWLGDLKFATTVDATSLMLDGSGVSGPSPVQVVAAGLAGCMAIDLAVILTRGRHPLKGLSARLVAERADLDPKRIVAAEIVFRIQGAVPADAIDRAIALSREKYCSVWHSLRQDIQLSVRYERREDVVT